MTQPCKAAMATRVGLGHLLDNFEDSRRPSSLSPRFHRVLLDGWMWRPMAVEAIYRETPRSKGAWTGPETGQAGWPGTIGPGPFQLGSAPFRSPTLLGQLLTCSLLHVGPWRRLLHGLDRAPCRVSFNIFCSGPWSFVPSHCGPWVIWSHVHLECWLVPGFMIFSQSAHWTSPKVLLLVPKSYVNNII
jgi:hypothetical protein